MLFTAHEHDFFIFSLQQTDFFCQKEFQISPYQSNAAINPALLTCISVQCGSFQKVAGMLSVWNGTTLALLLQKKYILLENALHERRKGKENRESALIYELRLWML